MWGVMLIAFLCVAAARGTAPEIRVACIENDDFPPIGKDVCPSLLEELRVELLTVGGEYTLNISWAVSIDASIRFLTGTRLLINYEPYVCEYDPPFAKAALGGPIQQVWFHHLEPVSPGYHHIQAANLPKPPHGSGLSYKSETITTPLKPPAAVTPTVELKATLPPLTAKNPSRIMTLIIGDGHQTYLLVTVILGGLVGVMSLASCLIIYQAHRTRAFTKLPTTPMSPVSVVLVYPAETPAYQRAVAALAEFLQGPGGCRVAVDMWQQVPIAQLGPMRWLAGQVRSAHRVIVVCPPPNHCPTSHGLQEYSVPATAQDLYPLVLNMVASYALSPSEMAKFWTVRLGETQDERPSSLAVELRACKSFCLMRDLDRLCTNLHRQRPDCKEAAGLRFRSGLAYSEESTMKLKDAIGQLTGPPSATTKELERLKSGIIDV